MGGDELNMEVLRDKGTEEGGSDDALEGDADAVVAWLWVVTTLDELLEGT